MTPSMGVIQNFMIEGDGPSLSFLSLERLSTGHENSARRVIEIHQRI